MSVSEIDEFDGFSAREYVWGFSFTKDTPVKVWSWDDDEDEDEDADFLSHTLYLKQATLCHEAPQNEPHVIQIETKDYLNEVTVLKLCHLRSDVNPMASLDVSFDHREKVTFRLVKGAGPVDLLASHLVEFPEKMPEEDELEGTEGEDGEIDDTLPEEGLKNGNIKGKRKAPASLNGKKTKRGKLDESEDEEEDEDEDDEDEEMDEEEESEEIESSPEIKKKGKKGAKVIIPTHPKAVEKEKKAVTPKAKPAKANKKPKVK